MLCYSQSQRSTGALFKLLSYVNYLFTSIAEPKKRQNLRKSNFVDKIQNEKSVNFRLNLRCANFNIDRLKDSGSFRSKFQGKIQLASVKLRWVNNHCNTQKSDKLTHQQISHEFFQETKVHP